MQYNDNQYHILKKLLYDYILISLIFQAYLKKNLFLIILNSINKSKKSGLFYNAWALKDYGKIISLKYLYKILL